MTGVVKRAAVTLLASSALLLGGATAAMAEDAAFFEDCFEAHFTEAGPHGAEAGHVIHGVGSGSFSE